MPLETLKNRLFEITCTIAHSRDKADEAARKTNYYLAEIKELKQKQRDYEAAIHLLENQ